MIRLKHLLKEDESDTLVRIARTGSGLISPKGKLFDVPEMGHVDFFVKQPKYKDFKKRLQQAKSDDWGIIYRAILDDALNDGWVRIISRGNEVNVHGRRDAIKKNRRDIDDIVMFIESVRKRQMNLRMDYV